MTDTGGILIFVAILWLTVATIVVCLCRVAAEAQACVTRRDGGHQSDA